MRTKKFVFTLFTVLLALIMCAGTGLTAYAAESSEMGSVSTAAGSNIDLDNLTESNVGANDESASSSSENSDSSLPDFPDTDTASSDMADSSKNQKESDSEEKADSVSDDSLAEDDLDDEKVMTDEDENEEDMALSRMSLLENYNESNSFIVYNYQELRTALTSNNNINTIYLGADIVGEIMGANISDSKSNVVIDGRPPGSPEGTRYTYRQYSGMASNNLTTTFSARSLPGGRQITIKNMIIEGANPYGIIAAIGSGNNTVLSFDNVQYNGPKMAYNPYGTVQFTNCSVESTGTSNVTALEIAESVNVEFRGDCFFVNQVNNMGMFLLRSTDAKFTIFEDAIIIFDSRGYIANCPQNGTDVELKNNSTMVVYTSIGFTHNTQQIHSLLVGEGASLFARHWQGSTSASFRIGEFLVALPGSTIDIERSGNSNGNTGRSIEIVQSNGIAMFNRPKSIILQSPIKNPLGFTGSGTLSITTDVINLWKNIPAGAPSIDNPPEIIWNKAGNTPLEVTAYYNGLSINSIITNMGTDDPFDVPLNKNTFDLNGYQMFTIGAHSLNVDPIVTDRASITGQTASGAQVLATYKKPNGSVSKISANAPSGTFSMATEAGSLVKGSTVSVKARLDWLWMQQKSIVQAPTGSLQLRNVPSQLSFGHIPAPDNDTLLPRQTPSFQIEVSDTRSEKSNWVLEASIDKPLTATVNGTEHTLPDALVYVNEKGQRTPLSDSPIVVGSNKPNKPDNTVIKWGNKDGVLLHVAPGTVYAGADYSTTINWCLMDTP